jgi:hypothetical protein
MYNRCYPPTVIVEGYRPVMVTESVISECPGLEPGAVSMETQKGALISLCRNNKCIFRIITRYTFIERIITYVMKHAI